MKAAQVLSFDFDLRAVAEETLAASCAFQVAGAPCAMQE
jgi:hypothetical protein